MEGNKICIQPTDLFIDILLRMSAHTIPRFMELPPERKRSIMKRIRDDVSITPLSQVRLRQPQAPILQFGKISDAKAYTIVPAPEVEVSLEDVLETANAKLVPGTPGTPGTPTPTPTPTYNLSDPDDRHECYFRTLAALSLMISSLPNRHARPAREFYRDYRIKTADSITPNDVKELIAFSREVYEKITHQRQVHERLLERGYMLPWIHGGILEGGTRTQREVFLRPFPSV